MRLEVNSKLKAILSGWLFIFYLFFPTGCATGPAPLEEYILAKSALDAARSVEASRYSPGFYHQADESFRRGKVLYDERDYPRAKLEFLRAKTAAERAENSARLIRMKNGEI